MVFIHKYIHICSVYIIYIYMSMAGYIYVMYIYIYTKDDLS